MKKSIRWLFFLFTSILVVCCDPPAEKLSHTLFRLGYKSDRYSTGPLINSGFVFQLDDTTPPLLITAHHVVASYDGGRKFYRWNEIQEHSKNWWLWSQHDTAFNVGIGKNIPMIGAKASHLDLAAYTLKIPSGIRPILPAKRSASIGDTVYLFTKLLFGKKDTFIHPAMVTYTDDSLVVYEFVFSEGMNLSGTSGAPVVNQENELLAMSFGSLTFLNDQARKQAAAELPIVNQLAFKRGRTYAVGIPVRLIKTNVYAAIRKTSSMAP
jgi:hypothetical protein